MERILLYVCMLPSQWYILGYDRNRRWNVDTKSGTQKGKRRTVRKKLHWHVVNVKDEDVAFGWK